jgi:hypothetical protein
MTPQQDCLSEINAICSELAVTWLAKPWAAALESQPNL